MEANGGRKSSWCILEVGFALCILFIQLENFSAKSLRTRKVVSEKILFDPPGSILSTLH